ncbi:hypothetical protein HPB49_019896 [Dermacentor silvarum]|uniref:Uncharacterized protein n=1 Tax=Dermacentor silvarum TaxID=543639 RepID=A0ACB8DKI6_DERSI|nr:hypothetical protein HPB49_019896 [Dermacentor silvarum]
MTIPQETRLLRDRREFVQPMPCREVIFNVRFHKTAGSDSVQKMEPFLEPAVLAGTVYCFQCVECTTRTLGGGVLFRRVLPLPSDDWKEAMGEWFCQKHETASSDDLPDVVSPKPDELFTSAAHLLVHDKNVREGDFERENGRVRCGMCHTVVGRKGTPSSTALLATRVAVTHANEEDGSPVGGVDSTRLLRSFIKERLQPRMTSRIVLASAKQVLLLWLIGNCGTALLRHGGAAQRSARRTEARQQAELAFRSNAEAAAGVSQTSPASKEPSSRMVYCIEGESISPEDFANDPRWNRAIIAQKMAYPTLRSALTATSSDTLTQQPADLATPAQHKQGKPSSSKLRRHAPLPQLPATDLKVIFRPGGSLDLRQCNGGMLLPLVCNMVHVNYNEARLHDRLRINPYNNSFTISTPAEDRAQRYVQTQVLKIHDKQFPVRAYIAAPDDAIRGIIYNAIYDQSQEEIFEDLSALNQSKSFTIADARPFGRTKSILVTFVQTKTIPKQLNFYGAVYACHPFKAKVEACYNCWKPGHRADVCPQPVTNRCHRCGEPHPPTDPPTCKSKCILCNGLHFTSSKECKVRFERAGNPRSNPPATGKTAVQQDSTPPPNSSRRSSRSPFRSSSRERAASRTGSRSTSRKGRHRSWSSSFPPLPGQRTQPIEQQHDSSACPIQNASTPKQTPLPSLSTNSSRTESPAHNPPTKRKAQADADNPTPMDTEPLTALTAAIETMQASLASLQKDNVVWMTNIVNRLTALEQRQGAQEATTAQMQTQVNGLLHPKMTGSAPAEHPSPAQHGCTP